jgi:hypothetical protein
MMKTPITLFCVALLSLGSVTAQQNVIWNDGSSPTAGSSNAFPFGSVGIRYQSIVPYSLFNKPANTIREILVAGSNTNIEAVYEDIEIRMGLTTLTTPTMNWATNNPKPTTVYRGKLRIRFTGSPASVWGGIGLPNPYLYLPLQKENLCVEVIVHKASRHASNFCFPRASSAVNRAFRFNWVTQNQPPLVGTLGCRMGFVTESGSITTAGAGCKSSANTNLTISASNTWPEPFKPLTFGLAGALKTSPAFFVLGTKLTCFDLAIAGAPGCFLWNDLLITVGTVTDNAGAAKLFTVAPAASGTGIAHWIVLDKNANNAGLTTSDYLTIQLGT